MLKALHRWNKERMGSLHKNNEELEKQILEMQTKEAMNDNTLDELGLDLLLKLMDQFNSLKAMTKVWKIKVLKKCLKLGDQNNKFFHRTTKTN